MSSKPEGQIELSSDVGAWGPRLAESHVRVIDIVRYHERWHLTAEQIVEELGVVSLADVYAALCYYHSHKEEMDAQMQDEAKFASDLQEKFSSELKQKLAELDAQVVRYHLDRSCPGSLAEALRQRGLDVTTTPEVWLSKGSDREQLSYAAGTGRILVTRDFDFRVLKGDCDVVHHGVLCIHPDRTIDEIVKTLTQIREHLDARELTDRIEFI
jgi:predicted nuclease of predicted toxin-antitoxin system/uncharacterized protein (DUF433 family)